MLESSIFFSLFLTALHKGLYLKVSNKTSRVASAPKISSSVRCLHSILSYQYMYFVKSFTLSQNCRLKSSVLYPCPGIQCWLSHKVLNKLWSQFRHNEANMVTIAVPETQKKKTLTLRLK